MDADVCEEQIDLLLRLKLPYNAGQRSPIMVEFRCLHTSLTVCIVEEIKYLVERLLRIVDDIRKCLSLRVLQECVSCYPCFRHSYKFQAPFESRVFQLQTLQVRLLYL